VGANIVGVLLSVLERAEAAKDKELDKVTLADLVRRVSGADLQACKV
jgi:DNA-binding IscR family transcriptional regulator